MIYDWLALLIIVQNGDDNDPKRYGSLVMPRAYFINDDLERHFFLDFLQSVNDAAPWKIFNKKALSKSNYAFKHQHIIFKILT